MSDRLHRLLDAATHQRPLPVGEPPVTSAELDHLQALLGELAGHAWDREALQQSLTTVPAASKTRWRQKPALREATLPSWLERTYQAVFRFPRELPLPRVSPLSPERWVRQATWARRLSTGIRPLTWLGSLGSFALLYACFVRVANLTSFLEEVAKRGDGSRLLGVDLQHLTPLGQQILSQIHQAEDWASMGLLGGLLSLVMIGIQQEMARRARQLSPGAVSQAAQALWDKSTRVQAYLDERTCPMPLTQEEVAQLTRVAEAELTQAPTVHWLPETAPGQMP